MKYLARVLMIGVIIEKREKEIEKGVVKGEIMRSKCMYLMVDVVALNVFDFVAITHIKIVAITEYDDEASFFKARRAENVEVIMRRLKPSL